MNTNTTRRGMFKMLGSLGIGALASVLFKKNVLADSASAFFPIKKSAPKVSPFDIVNFMSTAGHIMTLAVGPATATVEVLWPENEQRAKGLLYGNGSCGFISPRYAITNWHVVKKAYDSIYDKNPDPASDYTIRIAYFPTERGEIKYYKARIIDGLPAGPDYALLEVEGFDFPYLPLGDSSRLLSGQQLFTVGSPFNLKLTPCWLMVANTRPTMPYIDKRNPNLIQVIGPINPGMSGGLVVNIKREIVGLMVSVDVIRESMEEGGKKISSNHGKYVTNTNIGYITPINLAKNFLAAYVPEARVK
jgi:S1-C subfamily serine protease